MLIDTHAHLNFEAYNEDRGEVIERCRAQAMSVINIGAGLGSSRLGAQLAREHDFLYAAIGLHPIHVFDEEFKTEDYQSLIGPKVVAIGETGLDFYHPTFERPKKAGLEVALDEVIAKQVEVFKAHIALAQKNNLPLVLHGRNGLAGREVYAEMLEILLSAGKPAGVFHCYGGDLETAKQIISAGYYLGVDGPLTFKKKAEDLQNLIRQMPLENLLIETDAPYLTPEPYRGQRNEPVYVQYVAAKIAELKGLTKEEVIEQTWQNSLKLFKIQA